MLASARHLLYGTQKRAFLSLIFLVLTGYLSIFFLSSVFGRPAQSEQIHYAYLADAFLHGRLDVTPEDPSALIELVPFNNKLYVVYPPFPAIVMLPVVAIFGPHIPTGLISILFVALGIASLFYWLRCLEIETETAWWVSFLWAFGTSLLYTGLKGSSWYVAHVMGIAFFTMALVETQTKKRALLAGALLGAAFLCRLPILLSFPFVGWLLIRDADNKKRNIALFLSAVTVAYSLNMLYNWLRFDTFSNVAYEWIPGVLDQPQYQEGILHLSYLPRNIYAIFFQSPVLVEEFPYFIPSSFGLGVFFASPALLLMFLAPNNRVTWFLVAAAIACLLPALVHGNPGSTQFGYRFSLDAFPFLAALTAFGIRNGVTARVLFLILLSSVLALWGLLFIRNTSVQCLYPVLL